MKVLVIIARVLLGLMFVVFGLNGFFHFMKQPDQPPSLAKDFATALMASHYFDIVAGLQVVGGALCLLGSRFVPLGLMLLGPVIVNILLFHIFLLPRGWQPGAMAGLLSLFLLWAYRHAFAGLLPKTSAPQPAPAPPTAQQRK